MPEDPPRTETIRTLSDPGSGRRVRILRRQDGLYMFVLERFYPTGAELGMGDDWDLQGMSGLFQDEATAESEARREIGPPPAEGS